MGRALPAAVVHAQLFTRSCSRRRASGGRRGRPLWGQRRARRGARASGAPCAAGGGISRKTPRASLRRESTKQIKKIMPISANKWLNICYKLSKKLEISNKFGNSAAVLLHRIFHSVFLGVGFSKSKLFHKHLSQFLRRPCCVKIPPLLYYLI